MRTHNFCRAAMTVLVLFLCTCAIFAAGLTVHFIDVGQADSILIQAPSGQNILIDAGNNADATLVVNYMRQQGIERLDHVIGTHPHEDHIGGLDVVINRFDIGKVYLPRVAHTTSTYEDVLLAIKAKGLRVTEAKAGVQLDVGSGITATLLAPNSAEYEDLNDYSAVLRLVYGKTAFLFTGDAEAVSEAEMLRAGYRLDSDVLKVGHHGSASSTTSAFLRAVSPTYAVISVGRGNDYGHPHPATLARLESAGINVLRTDEMGTIVITSDGTSIIVKKAASPTKEKAPSRKVEITGIDLRREIVTIRNTGDVTVDLSGWSLVSEEGGQQFVFEAGVTLLPGQTIQVVSGPDATPGPGKLVWTKKNIWNNDGDPGALYDDEGKLVSRYGR